MSHILFISDVHLAPYHPATTQAFLNFLRDKAPHADALYILGDLFDVWLGDDDTTPFNERVILALLAVTPHTPIYLMVGNRDLLLGQRFCQAAGCKLITEPYCIDLYGRNTLLMHGDLLCTDDFSYLRYRQWVQKPGLQAAFMRLPITWRRWITQRLRHASQTSQQNKHIATLDAQESAVKKVMACHRVDLLIHGHTHRPGTHSYYWGGADAERIVLGAWHEGMHYLRAEANGKTTLYAPGTNTAHSHSKLSLS